MNLSGRIKQLELKLKPQEIMPEPHFDFDQFVSGLGLEPAMVHESSQSKGCSLVEAMCEMLNVDMREFKSWLNESVGCRR